MERSQTRGDCALAGASNLLGYKEYTQQDFSTNSNKIVNKQCLIHALLNTDPYKKTNGVGRYNIFVVSLQRAMMEFVSICPYPCYRQQYPFVLEGKFLLISIKYEPVPELFPISRTIRPCQLSVCACGY